MNNDDFKKISNLLDEKLHESEKRMVGKIGESEKRIIGEVGLFIEQTIIPQLDEKADKSDIERLERKLDIFSAKTTDLDIRVRDIESVPAIAHDLKHKKSL